MSEAGDGTILQIFVARSAALRIAILIADHVRLLKNVRAGHRFHGLVGRAPKRRSDLHGGDFTIARLARIWLANDLIFLRQPVVEHPAGGHISCLAPRVPYLPSFLAT